VVQVWKDKRLYANDKHDPWRKNSKHRQERQKNKPKNKETVSCCPEN
jgi:hypothetical protein